MIGYRNSRISSGVVFANPVNNWGAPYINQWVPIRRARWWESVAALFGYRPSDAKE